MKLTKQFKNVKLVYYTGTGSTEKVTGVFQENLINRGKQVVVEKISSNINYINNVEHDLNGNNPDLLILLFPIHACNAPEAVYDWIKNLKDDYNIPTIVISVSGGGEISPNTACRVSVIKMLENKNCNVFYEKMIVMPSNFIVPTKHPLSKMLLEILPYKIQKILDDVEKGVTYRTKPLFYDRTFSKIGELEKKGTKYFGTNIKVSDNCTLCEKCIKNCPSNNIELINDKLVFGSKCHICLGCIYACPQKALKAGRFKFLVMKEGYNLKEMEKLESVEITEENVKKVAKGYLWKGVKEYLLETD